MADGIARPLETEIRRLIAAAGPMPIAEYMRLCLTHPQYGYYVTRDPLGARGDFVTSPEISQMFGELIGLWMAAVWQQMGAPENVRVVELGPGRGTLMRDALRAAKVVDGFHDAIVVHLVEISPDAAAGAADSAGRTSACRCCGTPPFDDVPAGPGIVVANEFVDALPVHQAVKAADGWHERVVVVGPGDTLSYRPGARSAAVFRGDAAARLAPGARRARSSSGAPTQFALALGRRVRADGAALIIDYGHMRCALGDTVQAVSRPFLHRPAARAGRGRSDRACRFRGAGARRRMHRRARPRPDDAARISAAARHRRARARPQIAKRRATRPARSTSRCRA